LTTDTENLPAPDEQAKQHSARLCQLIRQACDENAGWISFADYMNMALYQPALGYYSSGLQKFGEQGDFITAPEVSPLFGQCLANQLADIIQCMQQQGRPVNILEFGAGRGALASQLLQRLQALQQLPDHYYILELSADLRARQQALLQSTLPDFYRRITWLEQLETGPGHLIVIANEVVDAMPVEIFRQANSGLQTLQVGFEQDRLVTRYRDMDASLQSIMENIRARSQLEFAPGYTSEFNCSVAPWLKSVSRLADSMVMFIIDYGYNEQEYYRAERDHGTLMCYYRHRAHDDFLWWPGLQDITAFVNFTDLAYHAVDLGLEVAGYTTQAAFLLANGLAELHAEQVTDDVQTQVRLSQQVKTLTLPSEMGERFKVMAVTRNYDDELQGFSMLDLRNRL
jgi:SAM-dependent MidA family methyltransferase